MFSFDPPPLTMKVVLKLDLHDDRQKQKALKSVSSLTVTRPKSKAKNSNQIENLKSFGHGRESWEIKIQEDVCVFCGSSTGKRNCYKDAAIELAQELVSRRLDLVYGGGSIGLMGLVSQAVHHGGGNVLGIIPRTLMCKEVKKHIKQGQGHEGGIFTVKAPLHASNVQVVDPVTGKPCKVGVRYLEDGTKVRVSRGIGAWLTCSRVKPRFCGISNSFVKCNVEGAPMSIEAPQLQTKAVVGPTESNLAHQNIAFPKHVQNKGQQSTVVIVTLWLEIKFYCYLLHYKVFVFGIDYNWYSS